MRKLMMTAVAAAVATTMGTYSEEKAAGAEKATKAATPAAMTVKATPEATFIAIDKDKDGNLTVTEMQAYFVEWFKKVDKNGDGKILPDEMDAHAEAALKEADANGDGVLVVSEIVTYRAGKDAKCGDCKVDKKGKHAFDKTDADKSGKIESVEYSAFWMDLHGKMDADKDGKVSADEYKKNAAAWMKSMDANKDGCLTCEEVVRAQAGSCPADKCGACDKPAAGKQADAPAAK